MGGKVLNYEAKDIWNDGFCQGFRQGFQESTCNVLMSLVNKELLSIDDASKELNMTTSEFVHMMSEKFPTKIN